MQGNSWPHHFFGLARWAAGITPSVLDGVKTNLATMLRCCPRYGSQTSGTFGMLPPLCSYSRLTEFTRKLWCHFSPKLMCCNHGCKCQLGFLQDAGEDSKAFVATWRSGFNSPPTAGVCTQIHYEGWRRGLLVVKTVVLLYILKCCLVSGYWQPSTS